MWIQANSESDPILIRNTIRDIVWSDAWDNEMLNRTWCCSGRNNSFQPGDNVGPMKHLPQRNLPMPAAASNYRRCRNWTFSISRSVYLVALFHFFGMLSYGIIFINHYSTYLILFIFQFIIILYTFLSWPVHLPEIPFHQYTLIAWMSLISFLTNSLCVYILFHWFMWLISASP